MTCTVDASVFVAAARDTEEHYIISGKAIVPTLTPAEWLKQPVAAG
jgi:hypothetical protein